MLEPYSYTPRRESGFKTRSRSETTIAEVAHQTCYSAAEVVEASADPGVRELLDRCQHILFEDWGAFSDNPARWPQSPQDAEGIWLRHLLQLCMAIHLSQQRK